MTGRVLLDGFLTLETVVGATVVVTGGFARGGIVRVNEFTLIVRTTSFFFSSIGS